MAGPGELKATNVTVALSSLLNGDAGSDAMLHNGDVLTIRQIPGMERFGRDDQRDR